MYSQDLESRILSLALERGLLAGASPEDLDGESLLDPEALQHSSQFGPRLDGLVRKGFFNRAAVEALVWEVILGTQPRSLLPSVVAPSLLAPSSTAPGSAPDPDPDPDPDPSLAGRFLDLQLLGEGAQARVYKAFDPQLQRWVALKFLKTTHAGHRELLLAEARAQAKVEHPNICRIHEVGETGERGHIVLEFARGATLAHALPALDLPTKVRLLRDVAEGAHAAHRQGLLHLDLKPGNILLQPKGDGTYRPLITDFGMVVSEGRRQEGLPCPMGTPPYSSPEQIAGRLDLLDRRSDIYALGVVLYVALCGELPFEAESFPELLEAIQTRRPIPLRQRLPEAPEELEAIVETCLAKDPLKRYPSALALADDLQRYLSLEPVQALLASPAYRLRKWIRRNRALASVLLAATLLSAALVATGLGTIYRVKKQARLQQAFQREVDQMEALLRNSFGMPFHPITPEVEQVHLRLRGLEETMAREGGLAEGPGLYAKGRVHLLLQDFETARDDLQRAWNGGFRTPETAACLAEALGRIYQMKLAEYSKINEISISMPYGRQELAPEVLQKLRQQYWEPAKAYMLKGQGALSPEQECLAEGLVLLHEGHPQDAIEKAHKAAQLAPWDPEALLLEFTAHRSVATRAIPEDRLPEAQTALECMAPILHRARELARSSPAVMEGETEYQYLLLCLKVARHQALPKDLEGALEAADLERTLHPGSWMAPTHRALTHHLWASYQPELGEDPREHLRLAAEASEEALRLKPDFTWALNIEGLVLRSLSGTGRRLFGESYLPEGRRALAIYQRLLPLSPFKDQVLMQIGHCYAGLGINGATRGEALAAQDLDHAIEAYRQAIQLNPNEYSYYFLGTPHKWRGLIAAWHGEDPLPHYDQSIEAYHQAIHLSVGGFQNWGRLADLLILRAEHRLVRGVDASRDIDEAIRASKTSIGLKSDHYLGHLNLGEALLLSARSKTQRGLEPTQDLEEARQEILAAQKWAPIDPEITYDLGRLARERLRWALRSGRPAGPWLAEVRVQVQRTLTLNRNHAQAHLLQAESLLLAASSGGPAAPIWRKEAQRAFKRAEALNPNLRPEIQRLQRNVP